MNCPRRISEFGPWDHEPKDLEDYWTEDFPSKCSFCGCIKPEEALNLIRTGNWHLQGTDKSHKYYLLGNDIKSAFMYKIYMEHYDSDDLEMLHEMRML